MASTVPAAASRATLCTAVGTATVTASTVRATCGAI